MQDIATRHLDRWKESFLWAAANGGRLQEVASLLEMGASVDTIQTAEEETPLLTAVKNGHCDVVSYLLAHGADPCHTTKHKGNTALHLASMKGDADMCFLILSSTSMNGNTESIASNLLLMQMNGEGQTPLDVVIEKGFLSLAEELKQAMDNHDSSSTDSDDNKVEDDNMIRIRDQFLAMRLEHDDQRPWSGISVSSQNTNHNIFGFEINRLRNGNNKNAQHILHDDDINLYGENVTRLDSVSVDSRDEYYDQKVITWRPASAPGYLESSLDDFICKEFDEIQTQPKRVSSLSELDDYGRHNGYDDKINQAQSIKSPLQSLPSKMLKLQTGCIREDPDLHEQVELLRDLVEQLYHKNYMLMASQKTAIAVAQNSKKTIETLNLKCNALIEENTKNRKMIEVFIEGTDTDKLGFDELNKIEERLKLGLERIMKRKEKALLNCLSQEEEQRCCVICRTQPKSVLLMPCRHLCLCQECVQSSTPNSFQKCPLCRQTITEKINVFA